MKCNIVCIERKQTIIIDGLFFYRIFPENIPRCKYFPRFCPQMCSFFPDYVLRCTILFPTILSLNTQYAKKCEQTLKLNLFHDLLTLTFLLFLRTFFQITSTTQHLAIILCCFTAYTPRFNMVTMHLFIFKIFSTNSTFMPLFCIYFLLNIIIK